MILHALTAVLVVLKALEMITIPWLWCIAPSIVAFSILVGTLVMALCIYFWAKQ